MVCSMPHICLPVADGKGEAMFGVMAMSMNANKSISLRHLGDNLARNKITRFSADGRKWPKYLESLNPLLNIMRLIRRYGSGGGFV
jgi:hypothetical protein